MGLELLRRDVNRLDRWLALFVDFCTHAHPLMQASDEFSARAHLRYVGSGFAERSKASLVGDRQCLCSAVTFWLVGKVRE